MDKKLKERIVYQDQMSKLKDRYEQKSHDRKVNLVGYRHTLGVEMIKLRDKVYTKRFVERKYLLDQKNDRIDK